MYMIIESMIQTEFWFLKLAFTQWMNNVWEIEWMSEILSILTSWGTVIVQWGLAWNWRCLKNYSIIQLILFSLQRRLYDLALLLTNALADKGNVYLPYYTKELHTVITMYSSLTFKWDGKGQKKYDVWLLVTWQILDILSKDQGEYIY